MEADHKSDVELSVPVPYASKYYTLCSTELEDYVAADVNKQLREAPDGLPPDGIVVEIPEEHRADRTRTVLQIANTFKGRRWDVVLLAKFADEASTIPQSVHFMEFTPATDNGQVMISTEWAIQDRGDPPTPGLMYARKEELRIQQLEKRKEEAQGTLSIPSCILS